MVELRPPGDVREWTKCEGFRFDGDTAYHVMTFLFDDAVADPERRVRERSVADTVLTREVEASDLRVDGRLVTAEGRIPPGRGLAPGDISPPSPPQITWGYDRTTDPPTVRLRHETGGPVDVDALTLRFEREVPEERYARAAVRPLPTDATRLVAGDVVSVELGDPSAVDVIPDDDIDWDAADPFAAAEPRPATRLVVAYSPDSSYRPLFAVPLGESE
jgi:hypothetical protein